MGHGFIVEEDVQVSGMYESGVFVAAHRPSRRATASVPKISVCGEHRVYPVRMTRLSAYSASPAPIHPLTSFGRSVNRTRSRGPVSAGRLCASACVVALLRSAGGEAEVGVQDGNLSGLILSDLLGSRAKHRTSQVFGTLAAARRRNARRWAGSRCSSERPPARRSGRGGVRQADRVP